MNCSLGPPRTRLPQDGSVSGSESISAGFPVHCTAHFSQHLSDLESTQAV
jgi:hypothetical protein